MQIEGVLGRHAEFSNGILFFPLWFHFTVVTAPFVSRN